MANSQARSVGTADANATTPANQREPVAPTESKPQDGPSIGENGAYLPASYKTVKGNLRTDR